MQKKIGRNKLLVDLTLRPEQIWQPKKDVLSVLVQDCHISSEIFRAYALEIPQFVILIGATDINGLVQDCGISIAYALEIP